MASRMHRPMNVRFQADADQHPMIITVLLRREPSVDFQTATAKFVAPCHVLLHEVVGRMEVIEVIR